ncbi:MAG: PAS domain-containing sensor histidine kinase [Zetaproteobacteria bacterium CG06_land_8_20_14_3_00_59_53]|nr:MAG: PAS domain-containing sensor histidine kinase [Zetaproteobacteria bacterium CG2_30_59_37]PIO90883.1 MAG: PAS domain-containing sensor histidine kinase [Zetaproteobacteria bacterium CG23_combo_of_CG06-09_8_20_14_all_59_86]PIQ64724.1 MAG: PAS domain-containing sensor histidine kinase [Zetaproteobacteria bacterium CG11_big_fil_rev_8_21_14_0_20_59_439]PIU71193.1 MAG: PAS domain-containing sensor histidine kinase [Zetaproteobacteria bacterium CG06_land_8_20_14_3_00_59_53]PIU96687.1 MAG: PAS 
MRFLPLMMAAALLGGVIFLWPDPTVSGLGELLAWLNIFLMSTMAMLSLYYGLRLLREKEEPRPGSRLRAKLVMALVAMLTIPSMTTQITANQMMERGLNVWFDVRVDKLLDRALDLARGFYGRIETDMKRGLQQYIADPALLAAVEGEINYPALNARLSEIMVKEGWQQVQLFDPGERLLGSVQQRGLETLEAEPFAENAKLALTLGRVMTDLKVGSGGEVVAGFAPLHDQQNVVGVLRAEIALPLGVVQSARAVEQDFRTYRELERKRQSIGSLFTNTMLIITLLVVLIAGGVAIIFARRLTAPIGHLAYALRRIGEGDLRVSVEATANDELGSLVQSFNSMAERLRQNVAALQRTQRELTEALDNSRQRRLILEKLLASLQTGVLLCEPDGRIRLLNAALGSLLNLPQGWSPGKDVNALCTGRLRAIGDFLAELRDQTQEQLQREIDISVGKQNLHVLLRGARLFGVGSNDLSGYLIVMDDISSLAEAQRNKAWAEVAQRLAHEIKNPLTPIKLAAERLQRRFSTQVDHVEVFDSCTHTIIAQVERLQRLISDFSTLARLPQPRLAEVPVQQLIEEMRDLYAPWPRVQMQPPQAGLTCVCDIDQIRQVLINLMDNALAATTTGGDVTLYAVKAGAAVELHVEDGGGGISPDAVEHIFEPYFSTKADGSGLGLAIARRIANEHEGDLVILSAANPTRFRLTLPGEFPQVSMKEDA